MDIKTFESIKTKIENLKEKKIRAEANIDSIEATWKKEYNISSLEEAKKLLEDTQNEISENEREVENLYTELVSLTDWEQV